MKNYLLAALLITIFLLRAEGQPIDREVGMGNRPLVAAWQKERNLLPLKRLDSLKIAVIVPSTTRYKPFAEMVNNYLPADTFRWQTNFSAERLKGYNLIVYLSEHAKPEITLPVTTGKTILVRLGDGAAATFAANAADCDAEILLQGRSNDDQQIAAAAIFGGTDFYLSETEKPQVANRSDSLVKAVRLRYFEPLDRDTKKIEAQIDSIVNLGLEAGAYPGCNVLVALKGNVIVRKAYGFHTFNQQQPSSVDDLYDLASVTKIAGGAPGILKLYDQQKLSLDQPVAKYFRDWRNGLFHPSDKADITLRELYAHQSGLVPFIALWKATLKDGQLSPKWYTTRADSRHTLFVAPDIWLKSSFAKQVSRQIRKSALKTRGKYVYSDLPLVITPKIVEQCSKTRFAQYLDDNFYRPLGAATLTYRPLDKFPKERIAPTELDNYYRHQLLQGSVHDESAAVMGGISGNAGLFASANDLAKLMQMYLQMGHYGGERYLSETTMKEFTRAQFPETGNRRGVIFDKPALGNKTLPAEKAYPCSEVSDDSFGHFGFTGTFVWMDPHTELLFIFLSNRVNPTRENNLISDMNIRTELLSAIYKNIQSTIKK